jgi:hypothetical protein
MTLLVQHQSSSNGPPETDYATDLSKSGLFIRTQKPSALGSTLQVQFAPQRDARLVQTYCRVTRVTPEGMGAEFLTLDADAAALIAPSLVS